MPNKTKKRNIQIWRQKPFLLRVFLSFIIGLIFISLWPDSRYDIRLKTRGPQTNPSNIVIVNIPKDDWTNWKHHNIEVPDRISDDFFWNEHIWVDLLNNLLNADPKIIAVNLCFTSKSRLTYKSKEIFYNPSIYWATESDSRGRPISTLISTSSDNIGINTLPTDEDGIFRRIAISEINNHFTKKISQNITLKESSYNKEFINFRGPKNTFTSIHYQDILKNTHLSSNLKGKIIIIGASESPDHEVATPLGKMSRAEVIANIIDNITNDKWIIRSSFVTEIILLAVLIAIFIGLSMIYPPVFTTIGYLITILLLFVFSFFLFDYYNIFLPILPFIILAISTYIIFINYKLTLREKRTWFLEKEQAYLKQTDELKQNFFSLISHDLKNPIAKIQSTADKLIATSKNPQDIRNFKSIRKYGDELSKYIGNILTILKAESNNLVILKSSVDVNEVIEELLPDLNFLADEKKIKITSALEPLFSIETDPHLFEEIFVNLVENAIKYTPENGKIHISTQEDKDGIIVNIKDNGLGISQSDQDLIWKKFKRGNKLPSKSLQGSGLGLYLVKYFTELLDGNINLTSTEGVGSVFSLYFPFSKSVNKFPEEKGED